MIDDAQRAIAGIKRGLALGYLHDLEEWRKGDVNRFTRMVDSGGRQIGSAESWVRNLNSICTNPLVLAVYPDLPAEVAEALA